MSVDSLYFSNVQIIDDTHVLDEGGESDTDENSLYGEKVKKFFIWPVEENTTRYQFSMHSDSVVVVAVRFKVIPAVKKWYVADCQFLDIRV